MEQENQEQHEEQRQERQPYNLYDGPVCSPNFRSQLFMTEEEAEEYRRKLPGRFALTLAKQDVPQEEQKAMEDPPIQTVLSQPLPDLSPPRIPKTPTIPVDEIKTVFKDKTILAHGVVYYEAKLKDGSTVFLPKDEIDDGFYKILEIIQPLLTRNREICHRYREDSQIKNLEKF